MGLPRSVLRSGFGLLAVCRRGRFSGRRSGGIRPRVTDIHVYGEGLEWLSIRPCRLSKTGKSSFCNRLREISVAATMKEDNLSRARPTS